LQKCHDTGFHRVISDFAFPKHKDTPTRLPKQPEIFTIADSILFKFRTPKLEFRFGEPCEGAATTMAVPETSMDEDDFAPGGENEVGLPGQITAMKPVAETEGVDQPPDHHFGFSVFRAHPAHSLGTLLWRQGIHHPNSVPVLRSIVAFAKFCQGSAHPSLGVGQYGPSSDGNGGGSGRRGNL
jgi:hypothetical protein